MWKISRIFAPKIRVMKERSYTIWEKVKRLRGRFHQWYYHQPLEELSTAFVFEDFERKKKAVQRLMAGYRLTPRQFFSFYYFTDEELEYLTEQSADEARQEISRLIKAVHDDRSFNKSFIWQRCLKIFTWIYIAVALYLVYIRYF